MWKLLSAQIAFLLSISMVLMLLIPQRRPTTGNPLEQGDVTARYVTTSRAVSSMSLKAAAKVGSIATFCPPTTVANLSLAVGNDSFFYKCVEDRLQCGKYGYPAKFGVPYSEHFFRTVRPQLSQSGQLWIDETLVCLQNELGDQATLETSCADVRRIALASHRVCYARTGYCALNRNDRSVILTPFRVLDFFTITGVRLAFTTLTLCLS
jgi:hypothetical protein